MWTHSYCRFRNSIKNCDNEQGIPFSTGFSQSWSKCNRSVPSGGQTEASCLESHVVIAALGAPPPRTQSWGPCCWSARPWGLMECLGHGVWLLGVGVRLHEVCFDLVGIAVQTLGIFSEGCSLELVLSFLPLLVSSVASPCAAATSTRRWPLIAGFVLSARTCMIQST